MATRADIIRDTLQNLRTLATGRSPEADDDAVVGRKLDRIYAELRSHGLTNDGSGVWALAAVPDEFVEHLVVITSSRCADTFHVPDDRVVRLRLEEVEARNRITRLASRNRTDDPAVVEQF